MPKLSETAKEARREQILEAARRVFAAHGYEGATVVKLERELGLSRGAIFNYFPSKDELFLALAERDADRYGRMWAEEGVAAVVHALVDDDPAWLGAYLEVGRRLRTDAGFRKRWEQRAPEVDVLVEERLETARATGELRQDIPLESISRFIGLVIDGVAMRLASGYPPPPPNELLELLESAIGGPARPRTPRRRSA